VALSGPKVIRRSNLIINEKNGEGGKKEKTHMNHRTRITVISSILALLIAVSPLSAFPPRFRARIDHPLCHDTGPYTIASADFDHDGTPDLATANRDAESISVLRGRGDATFHPPVYYDAGSGPHWLVIDDVDTDGEADLVVTNPTDDAITVLLGRNDGSFEQAIASPAGTGPTCALAGHLDSDGSFTPGASCKAGESPTAITTGDFDHDGNGDLAVTNQCNNNCLILHGNGDGTFTTGEQFTAGSDPISIDCGDLNEDGHTDLAVANSNECDLSICTGNGDGSFDFAISLTFPAELTGLTISPFDADTHLDLIVLGQNRLWILLGAGDGSFSEPLAYATGGTSHSIVAVDMDTDGNQDLAAASVWRDCVCTFIGSGDGTLHAAPRYHASNNPQAVASADLNGDGRADLAVANGDDPGSISILLGTPEGSFQLQGQMEPEDGPESIALSDLDGDEDQDMAYVEGLSRFLSIRLGNGDGTFGQRVRYVVGYYPRCVRMAHLNSDQVLDLAVSTWGADWPAGHIAILIGRGNGSFEPPVFYEAGEGLVSLACGDFNRDEDTDLAVSSWGTESIGILLGNGNGTFSDDRHFGIPGLPGHIVAHDFDRDGIPDLAVAYDHWFAGGGIAVLFGNGDGTFQDPATYPSWSILSSIACGDFDGDGKTDLAVADAWNWNVWIMAGNGDGSFQPGTIRYGVGDQPSCMIPVSVDENMSPDLIVTNRGSNDVSVLINSSTGGITEPTAPRSGPERNASGLIRAAPNPFRQCTTLAVGVDDPHTTSLAIYDVSGRLICTLAAGFDSPGIHTIVWNGTAVHGRKVPSGIYFSRLTWKGGHTTSKLLLLN
jgi:hypothetical protein